MEQSTKVLWQRNVKAITVKVQEIKVCEVAVSRTVEERAVRNLHCVSILTSLTIITMHISFLCLYDQNK